MGSDSRTQKWYENTGRSPKRNVSGKSSEAQTTGRTSNWQDDRGSTGRDYWQTEQWSSNAGAIHHNEWQGNRWESASYRTLDIPRRDNIRCNANQGYDCRFWHQKAY